ncbi:zinc finger protein 615-like [Onthophagus taurus]|uniref:zinc finger protein 615-like n=1 Tax=Onthophagus taurus TaxID=166361 RepID=UPI000C2002AD|nr:gastrula zinc finger protein XlCGF57.1-like [Onthophagus taurus]XP_022916469.1 gastrula zinc finger protein XlCGF57.1-like [Onthophagus taurus]
MPMFLLNNVPVEDIVTYGRYYEGEAFENSHFLSPLASFKINHEEAQRNSYPNQRNQNENQEKMKQYNCSKCGKVFLFKHHLVAHEKTHNNINIFEPSQTNDKPKPPPEAKPRPYVCQKCGKSFSLKHHLTSHERTHLGIRPHACEFCGKTFTHKHCLNTHLLLHSSERPYHCGECKKRFTLKHHLLSHAKVHNREKPFKCVDCGLAFALRRHLVTHSKFHAGKRPYVCEECGETFSQNDQLVMHSRFHGSLNSYVCNVCGDTFTRKFELVTHQKIHGKLPHVCEICFKEFLQKRTLIAHMRDHSKKISLSCQECGCVFTTQEALAFHVKVHTTTTTEKPNHEYPNMLSNNQQQPFIFNNCDRNNFNLNKLHQNAIKIDPTTTTGKGTYCCPECNCGFYSEEALTLHKKLHYGDTALVNDICTLATNIQRGNLTNPNLMPVNVNLTNSHKNTLNHHHPEQKEKKFICEHCSKGFVGKHGLQQHRRRHPDGTCVLKSHVCATCSKAFHQKNHLILHERQHMDLKGRNNKQTVIYSNMEPVKVGENQFSCEVKREQLHENKSDITIQNLN